MNPVINSRTHKWCPGCESSKELDSFSKNHRNRLGVDAYCKQCTSKKMKKYIGPRLKRRQETKARLVLEFGNRCADCKLYDLPIASFIFHHHSESMSDKHYRSPSKVITWQQTEAILSEKKKWIMLCANCHSVRHSDCKLSATKFAL